LPLPTLNLPFSSEDERTHKQFGELIEELDLEIKPRNYQSEDPFREFCNFTPSWKIQQDSCLDPELKI
jgi:hypothetical protein